MRNQSGLSLVELMISIALGLVLMLGVVQMFLSSRASFSTQQGMSRIQESGRLAMEFMSRDIRMAYFYGCYKPPTPTNPPSALGPSLLDRVPSNLVINKLLTAANYGVYGYVGADKLPGGLADLGGSPATFTPLITNGKALISHVLILNGAASAPLRLTTANTEDSIVVNAQGQTLTNDCLGDTNICKNGMAVISDCIHSRQFEISKLALDVASNKLTITPSTKWLVPGDELASFNSTPLEPAEVAAINTTVYFLAKNNVTNRTSLYKKINTNDAEELLEGVEQMNIKYHTGNGNYVTADKMKPDNWSSLNAVKIELLVSSLDEKAVDKSTSYFFADNTVTPPADDNRLRKVFTSVVGIRSR